MTNAYERGRRDAGEGVHVRSTDEDYLRGYAERVLNIPGSPTIEVHIARSDAWAGRAPSRTDAAYLAAYGREIRDCLNRTTNGTDEWLRKEGLADAVHRQPPRTRAYSAYLRGYADAAAVLLGAPAKTPTPATDPAQAVQRAQADAADGYSHQEESWEYLAAYVEAVRARDDAPLSAAASRMRRYADAASALLGQPAPPPQPPVPKAADVAAPPSPKGEPSRFTCRAGTPAWRSRSTSLPKMAANSRGSATAPTSRSAAGRGYGESNYEPITDGEGMPKCPTSHWKKKGNKT